MVSKMANHLDENPEFKHQIFSLIHFVWHRRNCIEAIKKENGEWLQSRVEIGNHIEEYFKPLFTGCPTKFPPNLEDIIPEKISAADNSGLCRIPNEPEIWEVVKSIGGSKALGPDGFTATFFQKYWQTIRTRVKKMVQNFFVNGYLLKQMNHSFIALIPKVDNLE